MKSLVFTSRMSCIIVDGNIGSGKSTLLKYLETEKFDKEHIIVMEPVDEWMKVSKGSEESLFEKYYKDKKRYGFIFQMFVLETRVNAMYKAINENPGKIVICERSHFTDCYVFAKMLLQDKLIEQHEYDVYKSWFDMCCGLLDKCVKGIIYMRADPSVCLGRIFKRMRNGEDTISYSYVNTIHSLYEEWLMDGGLNEQIPVAVVNANVDEQMIDYQIIKKFINMI